MRKGEGRMRENYSRGEFYHMTGSSPESHNFGTERERERERGG